PVSLRCGKRQRAAANGLAESWQGAAERKDSEAVRGAWGQTTDVFTDALERVPSNVSMGLGQHGADAADAVRIEPIVVAVVELPSGVPMRINQTGERG